MSSVCPACMLVDRPGYVIVFQGTSPVARLTKRVRIKNVAKKPVLYKVQYSIGPIFFRHTLTHVSIHLIAAL